MDLDKYKQGKLTEEELDLFTGELVRAKFKQAKKDKWAEKLAEEHQIKRGKPKGKILTFPYRKLAIAASVLLLVALIPFLQNYLQPESQQLANAYIENRLSLPDIQRGKIPSATTVDLKSKANKAYANKDFKAAAKAYEALLNSDGVEDLDYLFAGLSYLYSGNSEAAVNKLVLAQNRITQDQNFWEETNWFLCLAYIKNEELEKARNQLKMIIETDSFYSDKAQKILSTLQ